MMKNNDKHDEAKRNKPKGHDLSPGIRDTLDSRSNKEGRYQGKKNEKGDREK